MLLTDAYLKKWFSKRLKILKRENIYHVNISQKKTEPVTLHRKTEIDFNLRSITKDKEKHLIKVKSSIHQECKTILNLNNSNRIASKSFK